MKSKSKYSVRFILFASYASLILLTIVFFTLFFYIYTSNLLTKNAIGSFKDLSVSLTNSIDSGIIQMNILSLNITNSKILKNLIRERYELTREIPEDEALASYVNAKKIIDYLQSIISPFKPAPQINFYDNNGGMIGAGIDSRARQRSLADLSWYDTIDLESGNKTLSLPHRDPQLEETFPLYKNQRYISLYRAIFDDYKKPLGIIEIKQFADMVFRNFYKYNARITVLNSKGEQLYPVSSSAVMYPGMSGAVEEGKPIFLINPETRTKDILIVAGSTQSDWRLIVSTEERTLLKPIRDVTKIIIVFSLLLLGLALFIALNFAKRITIPLKAMHDAIIGTDWDVITTAPASGEADAPDLIKVNELMELAEAFTRMRGKLQDSMQQVIESRTHEIQATMFALQSQMDPHFIYNILTTISIMAEEGQVREISELIDHLTHLLRYISSRVSSITTLEEELEYAKRYLACMKIRFQRNLSFTIKMNPDLLALKVPKLIIQPIIENSMKYGISSSPPWIIIVKGEKAGKGWHITVSDNGPGFSDAALNTLKENMGAVNRTPDPGMQINGMGLLNTFYRLKLYYNDNALFRVENGVRGGARVTIGERHEG